MPPSALREAAVDNAYQTHPSTSKDEPRPSYLLDRDLNNAPREVIGTQGNYLILKDNRKIFDASGGAAVACLGHENMEVAQAMFKQSCTVSYCHSMFFRAPSTDDIAQILIEGTNYMMSKAYICNSGSEACEAAVKFAIQYHHERNEPRYKFIAREYGYHGTTLGGLSLGGHVARRKIYEPILDQSTIHVSSCNSYRQRLDGESDKAFVERKRVELDEAFRSSKEPIAAFFCEPISGAALGCAPYVPGYLAAMKSVCRKYGALFVLDEIMCGMGRSGTLHCWQAEHSDEPGHDCVPDVQMIGKGLAGGFQPAAGILLSPDCVKVLADNSGAFKHGQTYQSHAVVCAAAYTVQNIVRRDNLVTNVQKQGKLLSSLLHDKLDDHPNVGDIRGLGLFWGIEFVSDKASKKPLDPKLNVADRIHTLGLSPKYNMSFYPGQGTLDGTNGDHVIVSPYYLITDEEVELVASTVAQVIEEVFSTLKKEQL